MTNVKIAIWGFGAMGQGIASTLLSKKGVEIVGICDLHPGRVGKTMYEVLNTKCEQNDIVIFDSIDKVVIKNECDLCILATDSFTKGAFAKIETLVNLGVNVITTAEEMSYPSANEPELAAKINEIAKKNGVSVLGTGINPGLVMDLLAVVLSGAMTNVTKVTCRRINSLSPFGPTVMEEQGVGLSVEEFNKGVAAGTLAGHVGFAESVAMIADGIGLNIDKFQQQMEPIITNVNRKSTYGEAKAGHLAGVNMTGQGLKDGEVIIDMYHPQQIEPEMEGTHTGDYIILEGSPPVSMAIKPEIDGGIGTIALCVNCIPQVINADAGLITMLDIPVPRAVMGDFRDLVKNDKKIVK